MNPELLLAHFDRISDSPDAIPRLRSFILDLAVRGKLVEQDPRDEPASELLKRIQIEKERLAKANGFRQDSLPPIEPNEMPFDLPRSWAWIRVGWAFKYDGGTKREPRELVLDKWLLELEDIEKDTSVVHTRLKVKDRDSRSTKSEFRAGDILYGKLRPYLNKVVVADEEGYSTTEIVAIRPFIPMSSLYCCLAFRRPDFVAYVSRVGQGTKMPRLRTQDALVALFPLPPIAEQHRIVFKVNELMAACDRLEAAQCERQSRRDRLTAATYHHLNNGADAEALRGHAQFFIGHLPSLTARPDQIKQLRKTILNLAIRGQLVPQDPADEPASILLKRLVEQIKTYVKEQGIAAPKPEPIEEESLPNPAPKGWIWTRLCNLFRVITDGDHQPPPKAASGVAFLTIGNVTTGSLNFSNCRTVPQSYIDSLANYRKPSYGDILYTVVGATYGRPVLVDTKRPFCVQRHIAILKPTSDVDVRFLCFLLASPFVYEQATQGTTGSAQPTIPLRPLRNFLVPLPPFAEQRRIVAKVNELMALCDQMETHLVAAQIDATRLLDSMLYKALSFNAALESNDHFRKLEA
jgi:type I restriction enzyme S subunit